MDVVEKSALVSVGEIHTRIVKFIHLQVLYRTYVQPLLTLLVEKIFLFKNSKNGAGGMFLLTWKVTFLTKAF